MNALIVTSRVTFVPGNYDAVVCGAASLPQVGGLLVLDNASPRLAARALGLIAAGARGVGAALLRNQLGRSMARRRAAYARADKPIWVLPSVNAAEAVGLVRERGFDLVVNARTREFFGDDILAAPRLGCINVHHGLLPEQRGAMCDLWSLYERQPAGFSIHRMTAELDAGEILSRVEVSDGSDRDYPRYLARAARREVHELARVLAAIDAAQQVAGAPNRGANGHQMRRTPSWRQVGQFRREGLRV